MRLHKLTLRNFRETREFTFLPEGEDTSVFGANRTGKTTLATGYTWLLFNCDSEQNSKFALKTISNGESVHNLEHEVEAVFAGDTEHLGLTLRKVLIENWAKKRGNPKSEFKGHTTSYFIDYVPVSETDYNSKIIAIAPMEVLQCLTSPEYFGGVLKWDRRRTLLLDVTGGVSDEDIYAADERLAELPELLEGHSIEDHKKVLTARRKELNSKIADIPVRISEQSRNIIGLQPSEMIQADLDSLALELQGQQTIRAHLRAGGGVAERTEKIANLETQFIQLKNALIVKHDAQVQMRRDEIGKLKWSLGIAEGEILTLKGKIASNEKTMAEFRAEWKTETAQVWKPARNCPMCGALPENQPNAVTQEQFNTRRAETLARIKGQGNGLKTLNDGLIAKQQQNTDAAEAIRADIAKVETIISDLERLRGVGLTPEMDKIAREKSVLEIEVKNLLESDNRSTAIEETEAEIRRVEAEIKTAQGQLAQVEANRKSEGRIKDLELEQRDLAGELEKAERVLFLCDQFTRAQAGMLTESVNQRFNGVRFKLFDQQVNGALNPCCEVTNANGVPWLDMSTSEKCLAGLEIIRVLGEHYGVQVPIWCDEAESTTTFPQTSQQMIRLYVSEGDKTLRIERSN